MLECFRVHKNSKKALYKTPHEEDAWFYNWIIEANNHFLNLRNISVWAGKVMEYPKSIDANSREKKTTTENHASYIYNWEQNKTVIRRTKLKKYIDLF